MTTRRLRSRDRQAPHHDAGLQRERTAMSWQRTALGVGGVSALLLHHTGGRLLAALPGLTGLALATLLLLLGEWRYERSVSRVEPWTDPLRAPLLLMLALTVSFLAVLAIGLILTVG